MFDLMFVKSSRVNVKLSIIAYSRNVKTKTKQTIVLTFTFTFIFLTSRPAFNKI